MKARRIPAAAYRAGILVMTLLVMPISLLSESVLLWLDPKETSDLVGVILFNAIPLYVLDLLPGIVVAVLVIRLGLPGRMLASMRTRPRLVLLGSVFGGVTAGLAGLLLITDLRVALYLWPHVAWGAANGAIFGIAFPYFWKAEALE